MSGSDLIDTARRYFDLAPDDVPTDEMIRIANLLASDVESDWARGMDECATLLSRYAPPRARRCCYRCPA